MAVVPARGGSKGIPGKNLALLGGKPLLMYAVETGLACPEIDRVIVSTDDSDIAEAARHYGAEVPFLRPEKHARDDTPDRPVFVHLIQWLKDNEGYEFDYLVNLRCTTPFKQPRHVSGALELIAHGDCDSVRTVNEINGKHHPYWMLRMGIDGYARSLCPGSGQIQVPSTAVAASGIFSQRVSGRHAPRGGADSRKSLW